MPEDTQYNLDPVTTQLTEEDVRSIISSYLAEVGVYPLSRKYSQPITVFKTADETVTNSTLQNDDHLFFTGEPNTDYLIELFILHIRTSADNTGLVFNFTLPSGATYDAQLLYGSTLRTASEAADETTSNNQNVDEIITLKGFVRIGSVGGLVNFKWSAGSGITPSIKVYKGSWLSYKKLIYEDRPQS